MADSLADFREPLESLLHILKKEGIPHVLIGGLAVSQLCRPRLTADIDVLTYLDDDDRIPDLIIRAQASGFATRIEEAEQFARQNRVLLLIHKQTQIPVDVSLGLLPFERELIERSSLVPAGELQLPLPTVEDLIILKAVAHRPVDLQDIETLIQAHPVVDRQRVQTVVTEFAEALEMPEILEDLLVLMKGKRS